MHQTQYECLPTEDLEIDKERGSTWERSLIWKICFYFFLILLLIYEWCSYYRNNVIKLNRNDLTSSSTIIPIITTSSSSSMEIVELKYYLNTSYCHIPYVDPFTAEIKKIFKPKYTTGCKAPPALVNVLYDDNLERYILHIDVDKAKTFQQNQSLVFEDNFSCCYRTIIRNSNKNSPDASYKLLPCSNFHQDYILPIHIDSLIVECKMKTAKDLLQQSAHYLVQKKNLTIPINTKQKGRRASILLIGIDTISRFNLRRTMPQTYRYLQQNKWLELRGYNKIGDNTFPNLMAAFTGLNNTMAMRECRPREIGGLDKCNFIWKDFHKLGYYTAYAEDTASMSTFNYLKKGFQEPPTDYYFRPMALAIEKTLNTTKKAGLLYCIGGRQYGEYIYDMALEFATRLQNDDYFGIFWTNSFSHNSYDVPSTMDAKMYKYFKEMENRGIFEKSIVIFFSDHGARWGPLLKLPEGFLENRLPMFFISLPQWFRQQYPQYVKQLQINCERLTTPYDFYMSLQHLLQIADINYVTRTAKACPHCHSLFEKEIAENRNCKTAAIAEEWCTCTPLVPISIADKLIQNITTMAIDGINSFIQSKSFASKCQRLSLKSITDAKRRMKDQIEQTYSYIIEFTTNPVTKPMTAFAITSEYNNKTNRITFQIDDIVRQSKYETTAKCIQENDGKKFCICK